MTLFLFYSMIACRSEISNHSNSTDKKTVTKEIKKEAPKKDVSKKVPPKKVDVKKEIPKKEVDTKVPIIEEPKPESRSGEQVYTTVCLSCHQPTGQGLTGVYPPLAGSEWPVKEPSIPIRIVLHGLMGAIEVAGVQYNNVMSPQGMLLNDQEVANVLNYIRSSWGNKADVKITAEMVREQREKYPNKAMWNASELKE
jgi:mono/diheme cytochrome c family protein